MAISESRLRTLLATLDLPPRDYVVAGSAPLLVHHLKPEISDLDLVARGTAWARAVELGRPGPAASGNGLRVGLTGAPVEIFDCWHPIRQFGVDVDTDRLIDESEMIDGVHFLSLSLTLIWKRSLGRAKDLADVALIEGHLAQTADVPK
ncbi:hypothetical protein [Streptomyces sp. NBC_00370]|uniref:hypothetical protein n=1 Tax=Streptomyces sp. NBC_00370 TaxID=2975728 RepID=UPI002E267030